MKPIITTLCAVLFAIATQVSAQNMSTSFSVVPLPGQPPFPVGSHVQVDMHVANFINISSVLMPVTYDSTVLRFDSITNVSIPEYADTTPASHPVKGVIKIAWFPNLIGYPDGVTLANGADVLFLRFHFTVIGNGVSPVNLSTTVPFTPIEVINSQGDQVYSNDIFTNGGSINNGTSITGGSGNPPPPPLVGFKVIANNVYGVQGQRICMPVTVNDFDSILSMQYAIHWDSTVLRYDGCIRSYLPPDAILANTPNAGTLLLNWIDQNLTGITKPDGFRAYDVCFNVVGAPGTKTNITIDGRGFFPDPMADVGEVSNLAGHNVWSTGGPNGPSGITDTVYVMNNPGGNIVTFTADKDTVASGAQTCVDMKVKNFANVTESEFLLTYDTSKLLFVGPINIPATALNLQPADVTHSIVGGTGTIKFKFVNASGVSVADNTTIFSVCFKAKAPNGTDAPITFGTAACPQVKPFSVFKKDVGGSPYRMENGNVNIRTQGPTLTPVNPLCAGQATGSIANTPNGTVTTYVWAGPGINAGNMNVEDPTGLSAGTYTVTVTYTGGSTATASTTLTNPPAISMTQVVTGINCFGESTGSINITPSGGNGGPYTYSWAGPNSYTSTTQDLVGIVAGNYTVTIKDGNQCQFVSAPVNVSTPSALAINSNGIVITDVSCQGGSNGAISVTPSGGTSPYKYDWSNDGPDNGNPDDPQGISGLAAGTYTVTVSDLRGCTFVSQAFTVSALSNMSFSPVTHTDVKCNGTASGTAQLTVNGGVAPYTYLWSNGSTAQNPTNLAAGTWTVIVTDMAGCVDTLQPGVTIASPTNGNLAISSSTTPGACAGVANGSIDLTVSGGWGGYTYDWPDPLLDVQDQPAIAAGTYTVTVSDAGGCISTHAATVGGSPAISIGNPIISNVSCFGQGNGGICLNISGGAGAPYSVQWSNTSLTGACIGNLASGNYTPTVTDAQSCTAVFQAIVVNGPSSAIALDTNIVTADPTGSIEVIATGGTPMASAPFYTFSWSNGMTTPMISNMPAGTYTVTVSDANGCSMIGVYAIPSANVLLNTTYTVQNACLNDGCINITLPSSAETGFPLTLSWAGGSMQASSLTPSICGLAAGFYSVTITASNGNTITLSPMPEVEALQPAVASSNYVPPSGALQNGSITITPVFPNCTVLWNNGSTQNTLVNLDSGYYAVTVTNNTSQCTQEYTFHLVRQYPPLVVSDNQVQNPSCIASSNGSIAVTVVGGNPPYTYSWVGPNGFTNSSEDISNLFAGTYMLTVTDANNTVQTKGPYNLVAGSALAITNVNELSLTPGGTQVSGATVCDGEATVVFTGAVGNASILWSNGITTADNDVLCGGPYSVTVTDAQGCSSVWSDALTAPAAIAATDAVVTPKCFGQANGSAKVFVTGGIQPYDVLWSNGQHDQVVSSNTFSQAINLAGGVYDVTITDVNGVTQVYSVTVPNPQPLQVDFTEVNPQHFNDCDGERIAFVTGAQPPLTYTWATTKSSQSGDTERAEGLCAGDVLTYIISDANGCSVTAVDSIPYPSDGCFHVRPVLTPAEQDGNNDFTYITCVENVTDNIEIYNRWGQLVFQTDEYSNDPGDPIHTFTGFTRSGQALAEGVYYYVLTVVDSDGIQHQFKGHINLLK